MYAELWYRLKTGHILGRKLSGLIYSRILFREVHVTVNDQTAMVADLWDGERLKFTFRRFVDSSLTRKWDEVVQLASTITFSSRRMIATGNVARKVLFLLVPIPDC